MVPTCSIVSAFEFRSSVPASHLCSLEPSVICQKSRGPWNERCQVPLWWSRRKGRGTITHAEMRKIKLGGIKNIQVILLDKLVYLPTYTLKSFNNNLSKNPQEPGVNFPISLVVSFLLKHDDASTPRHHIIFFQLQSL